MEFIKKGNSMELQLDSRNRRRVKYCPCNKNNKDGKFVPFKDSEKHGYCHSCDRTFLPDKNTFHDFTPIKRKKEIKPEFIKKEYLKSLLYDYKDDNNNFVHFLERTLGVNKTYEILKDYLLGTSKKTNGADDPSIIGTSKESNSTNRLSTPRAESADIKCSIVETLTPWLSSPVDKTTSLTKALWA